MRLAALRTTAAAGMLIHIRHCRQALASQLGPGFDAQQLRIFASPFSRTLETARLAAEAFGFDKDDSRLQVTPGQCTVCSCCL